MKDAFEARTKEIIRLVDEGCEIRVWIYFESLDINRAFVLNDDFIGLISLFKADVYVDVWGS